MKQILIIAALCLITSPSWAQNFFYTLPDIPLMPGLTEAQDRAFSYDKPEGRIMVSTAHLNDSASLSQLQSYYAQSLPAFGWQAIDSFSYMRGSERLDISINKDPAYNTIEFKISP